MNNEILYMDSPVGPELLISNKKYLYFGGTSYFGLHNNKNVIEASKNALEIYGSSTATTRNGYGNTKLIYELEENSNIFFKSESSLYLTTGYLSSAVAILGLQKIYDFDVVLIDQNSHFCNFDAVKLAAVKHYTYNHLDTDSLQKILTAKSKTYKNPLIITDGVFPAFGAIPDLKKIEQLAEKFNAYLLIDDSHALGVLGVNGRGSKEYHNLKYDKIIVTGTFSKAFGGYGGLVLSSKEIINSSKTTGIFLGSSSPATASAAASLAGLKTLYEYPDLRTLLFDNLKYIKKKLLELDLDYSKTTFPVISWKLESAEKMQLVKDKLFDKNIAIQYLNYSGTGEDGILRIVITAMHTKKQLDKLFNELKNILS